ncbi:hypothetical protein BJX68DRAFT_268335 [Aspergillus pseudodeflectus]|uniref:Rhodopsin domain-containing protein n=1 Tax=Aspergillus pseudodeflectus TaxID=176178 RepID=A0ABR4K3Y4_9EURO
MDFSDDVRTVPALALYLVIWVEFGICTVVIALRAYSQLLVVRRPFVDDVVMIGAWIMQAISSGLVTASTHWGLGQTLAELMLDRPRIINTLKYAMISMPFGVLGPMLGRISFILFLQNTVLTVHALRRKLLWGLVALQVLINVIPIILQFTQCKPASALWDPLLVPTACRDAMVVQRYGYFQGGMLRSCLLEDGVVVVVLVVGEADVSIAAFNAFTDLLLIVLGLLVIINLKLRLQTKIALCGILSLSSLAMVAAILKTIQLQLMNSSSFSYAYAMWSIWFLTEGTVIIVTVSIPRLRPIITLRKKRTRTTYNNGYSLELDGSSRSRTKSQGQLRNNQSHRFGNSISIFNDSKGPTTPKPVLMRWDNHSGGESQDLIMVHEEIEVRREMQTFIHS